MFENLVAVLGSAVLVGVMIPWFLLILPPFMISLRYCQRRYVAASRELRRLDGLSRSPLYAHFTQNQQVMDWPWHLLKPTISNCQICVMLTRSKAFIADGRLDLISREVYFRFQVVLMDCMKFEKMMIDQPFISRPKVESYNFGKTNNWVNDLIMIILLLVDDQGLTSVRAYGVEKVMHDHFVELIDANNRAWILFVHTSRWLCIRLEFLATCSLTTATFLSILLRDKLNPGYVGNWCNTCIYILWPSSVSPSKVKFYQPL